MRTCTLLEVARAAWKDRPDVLFHHVSTDEVYGSLGADGLFTEIAPYSPRSPYSASKAASDHLARACHHTYGLPITLSNCLNIDRPGHDQRYAIDCKKLKRDLGWSQAHGFEGGALGGLVNMLMGRDW